MLRSAPWLLACASLSALTPTFVDNFDGVALDASKWNADTNPRKDAVNTTRALSVNGGVLRITTFTENGTHYTGFIDTLGKFDQVQGKFEARIRFSNSAGMWSAFWSMPRNYGAGGPATAAVDGVEIDTVEQHVLMGGGYDTTVHWGGYGAPNGRTSTQRNNPALPADTGWHIYGVKWDADGYFFYYDGQQVWQAPADVPISVAPQHIILSSEVKDGSWSGNVPAGGYGTLAASKTWMEVDWVRAWPGPVNLAPLASTAGSLPLAGRSPLTVSFDGTRSIDVDGSIASYAWSFSDGGSATGANATHTFASPGIYTATLTVTDDKGLVGTDTLSVVASTKNVISRPLSVSTASVRWLSLSSQAEASFRIIDSAGRPMPGVSVSATTSGLDAEVLTTVTDRAGYAVLRTAALDSTAHGKVTFTLRGATLAGYVYMPTLDRAGPVALSR